MLEQKKLAFFIPNIFTALNLGCGYFSILQSLQGNFKFAAILIVLGCFFDLMDGRMARMMGVQSSFGEQFDSLSDLVTFAMAPSILFYKFFLAGLGRVGLVVSFFFCLCGALRLARFNANIGKVDSNFFQGLPSPVAAAAIIGAVFFSLEFANMLMVPSWLAAVYITFYALLMISSIPFPSFKNSPWVAKNKKKSLFFILLVLLLIVLNEEIMIVSFISLYVVSSLIYAFKNRNVLMGSIIEEDEN
jgi:CDP-diacylglycerol--serine O-phosphatidyltransferase